MKNLLIREEEYQLTPEKELFCVPRYLAGAIIGFFLFQILLFLIEIIPIPGANFVGLAILWPGILTDTLRLRIDGVVLYFVSGIPFALVGSLIFTNNQRRKTLGIILLLLYIATSVCVSVYLLILGSIP